MSNQIKHFVENCIDNYSTYNKFDRRYPLSVRDLPDSVQHEFAALIMSQEDAYASEATGPDNPNWETKMLPALLRYLSNSTDKDEEIEFTSIWRECVTRYVSQKMQDLLEEGVMAI